MTTDNRRALL